MVNIKALQHIGIIVPDVQKSAEWYIERSGFVKEGDFWADGSHAIFVRNPASNVLFELIQRPPGSEEALEAERSGGHIDHVAYEVADLPLEFEHAKEAGMDIIEGICDVPTFWDNGFQYFLVHSAGREKIEYCWVL
ncbi:MAG: VOC family protein [Blautia sp.]|nr:VOC family protein [Blautia sp.]